MPRLALKANAERFPGKYGIKKTKAFLKAVGLHYHIPWWVWLQEAGGDRRQRPSRLGQGAKVISSRLRAPLHQQPSVEAPLDKAMCPLADLPNFRACRKGECSQIPFLHSGNLLCLLPHPQENAINFLLIWNPAPWKGNGTYNSLPGSDSPTKTPPRSPTPATQPLPPGTESLGRNGV